MSRNEKIFLGIFFVTLLVGIWQALPETSIIGDESIYVGGVLRALQAHTVVPNIDNSYTLSFFASYLITLPVLAVLFIVAHFHMASMVRMLFDHYELLYLVPRFVSVLASFATAVVFLKISQLESHKEKNRLAAVTLVLSTIVVVTIMHTGKMWALSSLLILMADYFCIVALHKNTQLEAYSWYQSPIFWCVGSAFLAFSNFPIALIAFAAPAVVAWHMRGKKTLRKLFIRASIFWALVFLGLTVLNLHGWLAQNAATPVGAFVPVEAIWYQLMLLPLLLPLLLIAVLTHIDQIRNRVLFSLAITQTVLFIVLVGFRAPWVLGSFDYLRYFFLIALLMGLALLATALNRSRILFALAIVSLLFFIKTLYLLVVPTTYNEAYNWITQHIAREPVVVVNEVPDLDLPDNATSYALLKADLCASRCEDELSYPRSPYHYTLITSESDPTKSAQFLRQVQYIVTPTPMAQEGVLVASFGSNPTTDEYYVMNHRLGMYTFQFLMIPRLGENLYVYYQ